MTKIKRYSEGSYEERKTQAWLVLISKARNRQTVTYSELSHIMLGKMAPQWKGLSLGHLYTYCEKNQLPLLPVIVVAKESGEPASSDLYHGRPVGVERERVFEFDWYDLHPPTEDDFA